MNYNIQYFDSIDSTNTYLYNEAKCGAKEGTVICANTQLKGKGRSGRTFYSPEGNLYMSILLRPNQSVSKLHLLTPMCAVCVVNAINEILKIDCSIKWVNDIFYNDRKVCGILTEISMKEDKAEFAVIGIGINVFECQFDDELSKTAGCLIDKKSLSQYFDKKALINNLVSEILIQFDKLYSNFNPSFFMDEYRRHSIVIGKEVSYFSAKDKYTVKVIDISDNGELVVLDSNGEAKSYYDGEIRINC